MPEFTDIHDKAFKKLCLLEQTWGVGTDAIDYMRRYVELMQELHGHWKQVTEELMAHPDIVMKVSEKVESHPVTVRVRKDHNACENYNPDGCRIDPCVDCDITEVR